MTDHNEKCLQCENEIAKLKLQIDYLTRPVCFAETDRAREQVPVSHFDKASWLDQPHYTAKLVRFIIEHRTEACIQFADAEPLNKE